MRAGVATSVLVQIHFPGALRSRLKAEKAFVMPVAEIWIIAWLLVFLWFSGYPGGFAILSKDDQGGQEGSISTSSKNRL